jgi:hypothetical protein
VYVDLFNKAGRIIAADLHGLTQIFHLYLNIIRVYPCKSAAKYFNCNGLLITNNSAFFASLFSMILTLESALRLIGYGHFNKSLGYGRIKIFLLNIGHPQIILLCFMHRPANQF